MKRYFKQPAGQPDSLQIALYHHKQRFNWDCGVSCVLMILPHEARLNFQNNFNEICKEEGFNKSTWTIDLCYLLYRFDIKHKFYTTTLGVHPGYRGNSFYQNVLTKDEKRVNKKFERAKTLGLKIHKASVSANFIIGHLKDGPVILLTNAKLLNCERCKLNKISTELRKCLPWPVPYQGHYIVICGYNSIMQKIYYRNPSFHNRLCTMSLETFEEARKSYGTDEDVILIYNN
ncbi:guanylyl cyclase domain containing protein 1 gucd1 [Holotrichia oblita]|uniref:Guanylyl cyclase domain containing protein 1 gucd1 n=1 Tax=Holotrichia oblita TaxID=644536 RepID=A0ACB9SNW1_HOLOL|nr:guanylyl cyclase domain containing protein 1 gucd1 [Holotrichia oblita]